MKGVHLKSRVVYLWALLSVVFAQGWGGARAAESQRRPHIIFILADDLGPGDLGSYGGKGVGTPHLDRLAAEGTRFTQYYSASPICSPSRAGLITGMHPARWHITSFLQTRKGNAGCEQADFLDPVAPSLPRQLRAAGYKTAHIGKWHLGGGRDVNDAPKFSAYGYDEHVGTWESPEPHPDITASNWIWSDKDKVKRWERTAFFVDRTLDFIERHREGAAFVNLWLDDPHTPWVPDDKSNKKDLPRNLRPVLAEMDKQIGRLLAELKRRGLDERTLVIFTSDNGALPTFQGERSAPFRGHKLALYEGGIRMPLIIRWPGVVPTGRVEERVVTTALDVFPTLAALAGAALPEGHRLEGRDLAATWRGQATARDLTREPLFWEYGRNEEFFRYGPDKSPSLAVRRGDWKLLVNADGSRPELYHLGRDAAEKDNLVSSEPRLAQELTQLVLAWRATWPKRP
jgi:arylsulfatase A-like enzyme